MPALDGLAPAPVTAVAVDGSLEPEKSNDVTTGREAGCAVSDAAPSDADALECGSGDRNWAAVYDGTAVAGVVGASRGDAERDTTGDAVPVPEAAAVPAAADADDDDDDDTGGRGLVPKAEAGVCSTPGLTAPVDAVVGGRGEVLGDALVEAVLAAGAALAADRVLAAAAPVLPCCCCCCLSASSLAFFSRRFALWPMVLATLQFEVHRT